MSVTPSTIIKTLEEVFLFRYDASTRANNVVAETERSRRNRYTTFNCGMKMKANKKRSQLQKKLERKRRRAELEKMVEIHNANKKN